MPMLELRKNRPDQTGYVRCPHRTLCMARISWKAPKGDTSDIVVYASVMRPLPTGWSVSSKKRRDNLSTVLVLKITGVVRHFVTSLAESSAWNILQALTGKSSQL